MKTALRRLAAAGLVAGAMTGALAAPPAAVVEGVQMPAWVEGANGKKTPLAPGMELSAGEQVRTGANSRLLLKLSEGSLVKLGENGLLRIEELRPNDGGIFRAALKVAEGAFRFTTNALAKHRRRAVNITVATVTAGIRGTDLWGKSSPNDRQVVCLIEGSIEVGAEGERPVVMDQPRQYYQRNQGETAPIGLVEPQMLGQWALETEIAEGQGAVRAGGKWKITLSSSDTQQGALSEYDRVRALGYPAEIHPVPAGGKLTYDVRIRHLPTREEAEVLVARLKDKLGVAGAKISM